MKEAYKYLITAILLVPLVLLAAYTFRSQEAMNRGVASSNKNIERLGTLQLVTPTQLADDVTALLEDNDFETALQYIDENLSDANIPNSRGMPLLIVAVQKDSYDIAEALLNRGADANFPDVPTGETALMFAAKNANLDMIGLLITANANVNAVSRRGLTPILAAIESKDELAASSLIARGSRAGVSKENVLAFAFAKNPLGIDIMLKGGADTNYADSNGNTALIVTSANGDLQSVKSLISYRANVNVANNYGMTPLLYAVKNKQTEIARALLNAKADVNKVNTLGEGPLYWAAYFGQDSLVNDLLLLDADYNNALTKKGVSAAEIAQKNGHTKTAKMITDYIGYKSIPRDEKGRPILPKVQAATAAPAAAAPAGAATVADDPLAAITMPQVPGMPPEVQTFLQQHANGNMPAEIPPEVQNYARQNNLELPKAGEATSSASWMRPKQL